MMSHSCQNCNQPLDVNFVFCPACGQKTDTRRLHLREILHDAWAQFTDIDRGLFTLLRDLVVRPGTVAREYIAGRRKKHFGPLNFYLIVGTILILMMNATVWLHDELQQPQHVAKVSSSDVGPATPSNNIDHPIPAQDTAHLDPKHAPTRGARIRQRQEAVDGFWKQYSDLVSIAAAPLLSFFFWLFYRRAGFNYTELLVASLYMIGFTNLIYAIVVSPMSAIWSQTNRPSQLLVGGFKLFEIGYFTYFYYQFTYDKARRPLLRAALTSVLVALIWSVLTISLVAVYMITGFGMDNM